MNAEPKRVKTAEEVEEFKQQQRKLSLANQERKNQALAMRCVICAVHVRATGCDHDGCKACCIKKCKAENLECGKHFGEKKARLRAAAKAAAATATAAAAAATSTVAAAVDDTASAAVCAEAGPSQ